MIAYLRRAREGGYSVLVMNPNVHYDALGGEVRFHKTREDHCRYVWDMLVSLCPAKSLFIASHSAGGYSSYKLMERYGWFLVHR